MISYPRLFRVLKVIEAKLAVEATLLPSNVASQRDFVFARSRQSA